MRRAVLILPGNLGRRLLTDLDKLHQSYVEQRIHQWVNHQQGEFTGDELDAVMAGAEEAWRAKFPACSQVRGLLVEQHGEPNPGRDTHADIADRIWPTGWPH